MLNPEPTNTTLTQHIRQWLVPGDHNKFRPALLQQPAFVLITVILSTTAFVASLLAANFQAPLAVSSSAIAWPEFGKAAIASADLDPQSLQTEQAVNTFVQAAQYSIEPAPFDQATAVATYNPATHIVNQVSTITIVALASWVTVSSCWLGWVTVRELAGGQNPLSASTALHHNPRLHLSLNAAISLWLLSLAVA